ncbi:protein kinase [Thermoproteota archaeon]
MASGIGSKWPWIKKGKLEKSKKPAKLIADRAEFTSTKRKLGNGGIGRIKEYEVSSSAQSWLGIDDADERKPGKERKVKSRRQVRSGSPKPKNIAMKKLNMREPGKEAIPDQEDRVRYVASRMVIVAEKLKDAPNTVIPADAIEAEGKIKIRDDKTIIREEPMKKIYMPMELIEGADLYKLLHKIILTNEIKFNEVLRKHGLTWEAVIKRLFKDIVEAVAYYHDQHVLHRDLKIENILIDKTDGRAKVCDFDLAVLEGMDKSGLVFTYGSIEALSPEQVILTEKITTKDDCEIFINRDVPSENRVTISEEVFGKWKKGGENLPNRSEDVWGLGIILYKMGSMGQFPWSISSSANPFQPDINSELFRPRSHDRKEIFQRIISLSARISTLSAKDIAPGWQTLAYKLLSADPETRISAQKALQDPWLNDSLISHETMAEVIQDLLLPQP